MLFRLVSSTIKKFPWSWTWFPHNDRLWLRLVSLLVWDTRRLTFPVRKIAWHRNSINNLCFCWWCILPKSALLKPSSLGLKKAKMVFSRWMNTEVFKSTVRVFKPDYTHCVLSWLCFIGGIVVYMNFLRRKRNHILYICKYIHVHIHTMFNYI